MKLIETLLKNTLGRRWTYAPDRASSDMPKYYGKSPRLDSVRVLAQHCASVELKLYSKKDLRKNRKSAEPIEEHEIYDLLDNPCPTFPEIDGWTLRFLIFAYRSLTGEAGLLKVRAENGKKIIALLPIPKAWIVETPTVNRHTFQITPYGSTGGVVLNVAQDDFVWFKDVDLSDPYGRGRGMAESIADEIETDEYASKYQKNFFFNDATPPFVITGFQGGQAQADEVKKKFMQKISGFLHAREPAVLTGSQDVKTLGIAPKELDMVESRKFLRDECLQHFQIPPEIMGIIENSNRSTIDASYYLMQKNIIKPNLEWFERVLNRQLLREFDSDLVCKHDLIIDEDEQLQLQIYQFGVQNGCITKEQFCEKFGINPNPEEGHYIMPISSVLIPAGEEIELPTDEPTSEDENEQTESETTQEATNENEVVIEDEPKEQKSVEKYHLMKQLEKEQWKEKLWTMFDTKAKSKEAGFVIAVKKIAKRQKNDIEKLLRENQNQKPIENVLTEYFSKSVDEAVKRTLAPAWIDTMKAGRENAREVLGLKKDYIDDTIVTNDTFNKWVESFGLSKSKMLNETTKKELLARLKAILSESIEDGDSVDVQVEKLIKESAKVFDVLSESRAYLIARTETGGSVNLGQVATYKANGVGQKEWFSTLDQRTRETHIQMMSQVVGIDESFEVERSDGGIDNMLYPLDPNGSAENVCNCRCVVIPVV